MRLSANMRAARAGAVTALVFALAASAAPGQGLERARIIPDVGTSSMLFGYAAAADGDVLVAGAPYDDSQANDAGAAYVYRRDAATGAWLFEQQLFPADPEASALFGAAVTIAGDVLAVGAPYEDNAKGTDAGSVYVFRRDAASHVWAQEQKFTGSLDINGDQFGHAVALSGNALLVGAPYSDTAAGVDSGAAYVYRWQNAIVKWVEEKRLVDSAATASNLMGWSVALDGDRAFVGSPLTDAGWPIYDSGALLTFTYATGVWSQGATLTAANAASYDQFGYSVAVSGDELAIGAPFVDAGGGIYDSGAVYAFRWSNGVWSQEWMVAPPDPISSQVFGNKVALDDDLLVIGSANDYAFGRTYSGSMWMARHGRKGWVLDQQFVASDASPYDNLGIAVAVTDTAAVAGVYGKDTAFGWDWGALYLYPRALMNLEIQPSDPPPATDVTFSAFYGDPGEVCLVTLEDAGGVTLFMPIAFFQFAADHALTFTITAPPTTYGVAAGFRSYRFGPFGNVVRSDLTFLDL